MKTILSNKIGRPKGAVNPPVHARIPQEVFDLLAAEAARLFLPISARVRQVLCEHAGRAKVPGK